MTKTKVEQKQKWWQELEYALDNRIAENKKLSMKERIEQGKVTAVNGVMVQEYRNLLNKYFQPMPRCTDLTETWLMGFLEIMEEVQLILQYYKEGNEDEANRMRRLQMTYDSCLRCRDITPEMIENQRWVC